MRRPSSSWTRYSKASPDLHLALLGALAKDVGQDILEIDVHLFDTLVRDDFKGRRVALAHIDLDHAVVELAFAELLAQFFAGALVRFVAGRGEGERIVAARLALGRGGGSGRWRGRRQKQVEQPLFGVQFCLVFYFFKLFFAHHVDGYLDQVAHDGFDVAAHVADLGELGGFDLQERRVR